MVLNASLRDGSGIGKGLSIPGFAAPAAIVYRSIATDYPSHQVRHGPGRGESGKNGRSTTGAKALTAETWNQNAEPLRTVHAAQRGPRVGRAKCLWRIFENRGAMRLVGNEVRRRTRRSQIPPKHEPLVKLSDL